MRLPSGEDVLSAVAGGGCLMFWLIQQGQQHGVVAGTWWTVAWLACAAVAAIAAVVGWRHW